MPHFERTQVYFTPRSLRALRREAKGTGVSLTELLRRIVAAHVGQRAGVESFSKERVLSFVALGRSGREDGSERHDAALDEGFRAGALR